MMIHIASPADAEDISALIIELSTPFFVSPTRQGAEPFLASISAEATRRHLESDRYWYCVARSNDHLAGFAALRDNSHLFHLFVATPFQRRRLASQLWSTLKLQALQRGNAGSFTVNSSINALPVYEHFGFVCQGEARQMNGISFQPMILGMDPPQPDPATKPAYPPLSEQSARQRLIVDLVANRMVVSIKSGIVRCRLATPEELWTALALFGYEPIPVQHHQLLREDQKQTPRLSCGACFWLAGCANRPCQTTSVSCRSCHHHPW